MSPRYHDTFGHGHLPSRVSHGLATRPAEDKRRNSFRWACLIFWVAYFGLLAVIGLWAAGAF